jgi:hypothetical protein
VAAGSRNDIDDSDGPVPEWFYEDFKAKHNLTDASCRIAHDVALFNYENAPAVSAFSFFLSPFLPLPLATSTTCQRRIMALTELAGVHSDVRVWDHAAGHDSNDRSRSL